MFWINGKMTDLTKKDAIHKLVDAKCFLERYSNPHDKWTEAINIGIEAIEIVMAQEEQEPTTKNDLTEQCIACKYDETEDENGEHCKKCLAGDSQFELDDVLIESITKNGSGIELSISHLEPDNCGNYVVQEPTTKNDLGVDREQLKNMIRGLTKWYVKRDNAEVGQPNTAVGLLYDDVMFGIDRLPSVTPQEPQTFKWCETCKEYDQEKHCCHRWSKVIRDTVEEMKQEPILDKIRADIEKLRPNLRPEQMTDYDYAMVEVVDDIVAIIDKYKADRSVEE